MSKCPWLLHGAVGKIGNIVVQRAKGVTTVRELVVPTNPRTRSQQLQRCRFGYLAKFYAEGVRQFFKFSFENKKPNESDFNAFMRQNKTNMLYATRSMLDNPDSCAFGPYRLTSGSIPGYGSRVIWSEQDGQLEYLDEKIQGDENWGDISSLLLERNPGWQNGDIITFVTIADSNPRASFCNTVAEAIANDSFYIDVQGSIWRFVQVRIDVNDLKDPQDYGIGCTRGMLTIVVSPEDPYSDKVAGGTMVVSRVTPQGVLVSTSFLEISDDLRAMLDYVNADSSWKEHCAISMGAVDKSILEGSIVDENIDDPSGKFSISPDPLVSPSSGGTVSGTYVSTLSSFNRLRAVIDGHLYLVNRPERMSTPPDPWGAGYQFSGFSGVTGSIAVECGLDGTPLANGRITGYFGGAHSIRLLLI